MKSEHVNLLSLEFHPLTPDRWDDFETLFGERGACGGCWCMWWRLAGSAFEKQKGEPNRLAMKKITASGKTPGILAYSEGVPVGWCSVAPREAFPRLGRSIILKPVDDVPVWSVVCFYIPKASRRSGLSLKLLEAAVAFVKGEGGCVVEGYPVEPKKERYPDPFAYTGFASTFRKAGFVEFLRRSGTRPIMRFFIDG